MEVSVDLTTLGTALGANKEFTVQLKPMIGAVLRVTRTTPVELDAVINLQ